MIRYSHCTRLWTVQFVSARLRRGTGRLREGRGRTMSGMSLGSVHLSVCPVSALVDDPVHITVTGLRSGQEVTVQAELEEDGIRFGSAGHFLSDQYGEVDLTTSPSLGGTYTGVEPMGLFWSKKSVPGQRSGLRLLKKDVTVPYRVLLSVRQGHLPWEKLWDSPPAPLTRAQALRYYMHKAVTRTEIEHGRIRGTLFVPAGKGPFPGVIDMFGTAGGLLEFRASLLASRGFTTLALPYFNYKDLPRALDDVDLGYFLEAVEWFSSLPDVQRGGIGVGGVSKGGELSLLLAAHCPQISACVNISGPPHVTLTSMKHGDTHLPGARLRHDKVVHTEEGAFLAGAFPYEREHAIPFGRSRAKFLVLLGEDDGSYSGDHIIREINYLPAEKQKDIEVITYPGAGHLLEPPYAPHCRSSYYSLLERELRKHKGEEGRKTDLTCRLRATYNNANSGVWSSNSFVDKVSVVWGGEAKAHNVAQEHSWARILQFYREHVGNGQMLRTDMNSKL